MWDFPGGSVIKNPPANVGDPGSIPGLGRSPGRGNDRSIQYSCLGSNRQRSLAAWGHKEWDMTEIAPRAYKAFFWWLDQSL